MIKVDMSHSLWEERYRPRTFEDIILPSNLREKFKTMMKMEQFPPVTLSSSKGGLGKTTLVHCLMNDLKVETKWINGSKDNGKDVFGQPLDIFVMQESLDDDVNKKLIVIDEADKLTQQAQGSLRGQIEALNKVSSFILTCNFPSALIEPIKSRCPVIDFDKEFADPKNKKDIAKQMVKRCEFILKNEKVKYDKKDVLKIITHFYPSTRDIIKQLELNVVVEDGQRFLRVPEKFDMTISVIENIFKNAKKVEWLKLRDLVDSMSNPNAIFSYVYKNEKHFKDLDSWSQGVMIANKHQYQSKFADNIHLNVLGFMVEIIMKKLLKTKV